MATWIALPLLLSQLKLLLLSVIFRHAGSSITDLRHHYYARTDATGGNLNTRQLTTVRFPIAPFLAIRLNFANLNSTWVVDLAEDCSCDVEHFLATILYFAFHPSFFAYVLLLATEPLVREAHLNLELEPPKPTIPRPSFV